MNLKLPYKRLPSHVMEWQYRVMFFDPIVIERLIQQGVINPWERFQHGLKWMHLFPCVEGSKQCACGCGKELKGRQTRWASKECQDFAGDVHKIIYGDTSQTIYRYLVFYYGPKCCKCESPTPGDTLYVDHITAVTNGGGGSWLSNFQLLCRYHHEKKTKSDINFKKTNHLLKLPFNE